MKIRIPVLLAAAFLLWGCSEPTLEELKADEELLSETLSECRERSGEAFEDGLCQRAGQAAMEKAGERVGDLLKGMVDGMRKSE